MQRRDFLAGSLATGAGILAAGNLRADDAKPALVYELPPLPYAVDALEPHIDAQTMEIHHGRHHAAYIARLNAAIAGRDLGNPTIEQLVADLEKVPEDIRTIVRNHGGGHLNHCIFWDVMSPNGGGEPEGYLARGIERSFGSFDKFVEAFVAAAGGVFGSGWAWLSMTPERRLVVGTTANQDNPITHGHIPLLGIDVWEHAYYLKYQNRRADYIQAWLKVIAWDRVAARHAEAWKQLRG